MILYSTSFSQARHYSVRLYAFHRALFLPAGTIVCGLSSAFPQAMTARLLWLSLKAKQMKTCDRPNDEYLISWSSMALRVINYPLDFQLRGPHISWSS